MNARRLSLVAGGLVAAFLLTVPAAFGLGVSQLQAPGSLQVDATLRAQYRFDPAYCPPGTKPESGCVRFVGSGPIAGLGRATTTYTKILPPDEADCPVVQFNSATIEIAGKGTFDVARHGRSCGPTAPASVAPHEYAVTGGSGMYAGASGTLVFRSSVNAVDFGCSCGSSSDSWTGTLTVPGAQFDVATPALTGATSKLVRVPRGVSRARVRYAVVARDGVDGNVPVTCTPRSGSSFALGSTKVTCEAADTSGNVGKAQFTVTVKRR